MDLKRIRATQSTIDRIKEIDEQIKLAEKDPNFTLSEIFEQFSIGGSLVFVPLQDKFANRDFEKTFYFKILEHPNDFPDGKFLANLGDKEKILDYKTGKYRNISTKDKNAMLKTYRRTKDPSEHYILFDVLDIDENSCVKCNLKAAIALIMYHTDLFDSTRKASQVKELSETEYLELNKKTRKSTKSE